MRNTLLDSFLDGIAAELYTPIFAGSSSLAVVLFLRGISEFFLFLSSTRYVRMSAAGRMPTEHHVQQTIFVSGPSLPGDLLFLCRRNRRR